MATVLLVWALPAAPAVADAAPPPAPTAQQEAFRASVLQMIGGLNGVVAAAQSNPLTAPGFKVTGGDPSSMIAAAKTAVAGLSSTDLDRMQTLLASDPSWPQIPSTLQSALAKAEPQPKGSLLAPGDFRGTFTGSCNGAGSAPGLFVATLLANQAQSGAQAALLGAPGVFALIFVTVPTGVKIAFAVIWGVVNAVFLGLSQALAVATDCAATAFANIETPTFPVDPTNGATLVAGSSELSVQRIITLATATQQEISNVQNTVSAVNTQAGTVVTAANNLNTTLTDVNTRASEVQGDLQTLQANVAILENTEVTVLNKANLEITNLSVFQQLQVRMEIEANLSRPAFDTGAVALYQLPNAFGGYLETVKAIVTDTVAKQTAVGHGSPAAAGDLDAANAEFGAGHYKHAYQLYSKAYTDVTKP